MRYEYLILLILIGSVTFVSNNSQNDYLKNNFSNPIHISKLNTPSTIHKASANSNLNITYNQTISHSQQISLNSSSKYDYVSDKNFSTSIRLESAQVNNLETIPNMYTNIISQNSGNLVPSLENNQLKLETQTPTTLATKKITENRPISQNSTINLNYQILNFGFSQDKFAVSYIKFIFDSMEVSIILAHSQKYETITTNSTGKIKLYAPLSDLRVNLMNLCQETGDQYPSILTDIIWGTASEDVFSFVGLFSQLAITAYTSNINLDINGKLEAINLNQPFGVQNTRNISIQPEIGTYLCLVKLTYEYHGLETSNGILENNNDNVFFNGELVVNQDFLPDWVKISFPTTTEFFDTTNKNILVNNTESNLITISNITQLPLSISFRLKVKYSIDTNISWSLPLQGKNLTINKINKDPKLILLSDNQNLLNVKNSSTGFYFPIPIHWPQGKSFLLSWDSKPSIVNEILFSKMYPILQSSNNISALPGRYLEYECNFLNSTSNERYFPQSMNVIIGKNFVQKYTNSTIRIPPILKPGDYMMNITIGDLNVINATQNVFLHIEQFNPQFSVNIQRINLDKFSMLLNISEYQDWNIQSSIVIKSESKNTTIPLENQFTSITIEDKKLGNQNESILISIELDNLINSSYQQIYIPNYISQKNNINFLVLTLTSFVLAPTIFISTKYIKANYFNKSLSF